MTMPAKPQRNATTVRFNDDYTRRIVYAAAEMQGQSLTAFILSAIRDRAESVIKERRRMMREIETIVLSPEASVDFVKTLEEPPAPNAEMVKAMRAVKAMNISSQD